MIKKILCVLFAVSALPSICLSQRIYPSRLSRPTAQVIRPSIIANASLPRIASANFASPQISIAPRITANCPDSSSLALLLMWHSLLSSLYARSYQAYPFASQPIASTAFTQPSFCAFPGNQLSPSPAHLVIQQSFQSQGLSNASDSNTSILIHFLGEIESMKEEINRIRNEIMSIESKLSGTREVQSGQAKTQEFEKLQRLKRELEELKSLLEEYRKR